MLEESQNRHRDQIRTSLAISIRKTFMPKKIAITHIKIGTTHKNETTPKKTVKTSHMGRSRRIASQGKCRTPPNRQTHSLVLKRIR